MAGLHDGTEKEVQWLMQRWDISKRQEEESCKNKINSIKMYVRK
jgi:hypothetical protein